MQKPDLNYWYQYLEKDKILYFKYNKCQQMEDEEAGTIADFTNEILDIIDNNQVEKFVIDMRDNGGGSDKYLNGIREGIKERKINKAHSKKL